MNLFSKRAFLGLVRKTAIATLCAAALFSVGCSPLKVIEKPSDAFSYVVPGANYDYLDPIQMMRGAEYKRMLSVEDMVAVDPAFTSKEQKRIYGIIDNFFEKLPHIAKDFEQHFIQNDLGEKNRIFISKDLKEVEIKILDSLKFFSENDTSFFMGLGSWVLAEMQGKTKQTLEGKGSTYMPNIGFKATDRFGSDILAIINLDTKTPVFLFRGLDENWLDLREEDGRSRAIIHELMHAWETINNLKMNEEHVVRAVNYFMILERRPDLIRMDYGEAIKGVSPDEPEEWQKAVQAFYTRLAKHSAYATVEDIKKYGTEVDVKIWVQDHEPGDYIHIMKGELQLRIYQGRELEKIDPELLPKERNKAEQAARERAIIKFLEGKKMLFVLEATPEATQFVKEVNGQTPQVNTQQPFP